MVLTASQTERRYLFWKCLLIVLLPLFMISLGPFIVWASVFCYCYQRRIIGLVRNLEQVTGTVLDRREGDDAIEYSYGMNNNTMYKGSTTFSCHHGGGESIHLLVDPCQHRRCYVATEVEGYKRDTRRGVLFAYVIIAVIGVLVTMLIACACLFLACSFARFTSLDFTPPTYFTFLGYMTAIGNFVVACGACWVREDMMIGPKESEPMNEDEGTIGV